MFRATQRGSYCRKRKRHRTWRVLLVTIVLPIVTALAWRAFVAPTGTRPVTPSDSTLSQRQAVNERFAYPVYPYSVIAGGVHNRAELAQAIARDPVVAKHYEEFDQSKAMVIRLAAAKAAFVSYRKGSQVYWTREKLRLPEGEALITDGIHYARTRCGNRVSDVPRTPTLRNDPPPEAFDTPVETRIAELPRLGPPGLWEVPPLESGANAQPPGQLPPSSLPPAGGPGTPGVPILPIVPPGGGGFPPPEHPPTPITPVPEPATMVLVGAGLAAWKLIRNRN